MGKTNMLLRLSVDLKQELQQMANSKAISLTALILWILDEYVQQKKRG